jgi:hypothetical protein
LLDSQSQSIALTALNELQSMWVPSALNFKTNYSDAGVTNTNAVEFVVVPLVQIVYRFPKLLAQNGPVSQSGTIENLLSVILSEGQTGEINHIVAVSYTNVWLTRVSNLILTGQGLADGYGNILLAASPDVINRGRTDLVSWARTVREDGIHEFLSPAYTGLDLEALGYLELYAKDPGIAGLAQQGYKLFWIELYANWYYKDQRLGGTHSRTYEFLTDQDRKTDRFCYAASNPVVSPTPPWPALLTARTPLYWHGQDFIAYVLPPPGDVPYLFPAQVPVNGSRTILRNFGLGDSNFDSTFFFGENYMGNPSGAGGLSYPFSVGSTEASYNDPTFEGLTIMLPGNGSTANVNFNMQGRRDYYLQQLIGSKSETLKPFIASAQSGAEPASGAISVSVPGWHGVMTLNTNVVTETTTSVSGSDIDSAPVLPLVTVDGTEVTKTLQDSVSRDVGNAVGGSAIPLAADGFYSGAIQVAGAGTDIWGTADGFQFYYQKLVGNGTVIGRLTNMPTGNTVDSWAKAGLMMRNDLTAGSPNAYIGLDGTNGQRFSVRATPNGTSVRTGSTTTTVPYWFKLVRTDNTFTAYSSQDGVNWIQVGSPTNIAMNQTVYVGIAVTSHNPNGLLTTSFDNVGALQQ